jgi:hypothetical protein
MDLLVSARFSEIVSLEIITGIVRHLQLFRNKARRGQGR